MESKIEYKQGDALKVIDSLKDNEFDLIISSPPYNIGKEYENIETVEKYINNQSAIIEKLVKKLSLKGSICWQVGNTFDPKSKEIIPLDIIYYSIFKSFGLKLRNRIIWHFGHGLHSSRRFSGRYEVILWFTKSDSYIFNLDKVRIPSKYPGKRFFKGPKKGKLSGNPKGKNPSDFWQILQKDWEEEIWEIPNVKANHKEKTVHPCQYPIELVERCILAFTDERSWILDPFAGVGSTLLAAYLHNRNAIGIELFKDYIEIGLDRLALLKEKNLKYRMMTEPIYNHLDSNLSKIPEEFKKNNENK